MPEVVINSCYGRFSLSPKGLARLAELKGKTAYFATCQHVWEVKSIWTPIGGIPDKDCPGCFAFDTRELDGVDDQKWWDLHHLDSRPEDRADPDLVRVVKEMGQDAGGTCSELKIVTIPEGVEWEVEEYDGNEWVTEVRRTWR